MAREISVRNTITWEVVNETVVEGKIELKYLTCNFCSNDAASGNLPVVLEKINLSAGEIIEEVSLLRYESRSAAPYVFTDAELSRLSAASPEFSTDRGMERNTWKGLIRFTPLVSKNGSFEIITSYELLVRTSFVSAGAKGGAKTSFAANSVLATGEWYKIAVDHSALYKLSYRFLRDKGLDIDNIDPRTISIFGNGGGMLPFKNSESRPDDLSENSIYIQGEGDGKFDKGDYILFYGSGPHQWKFNAGDSVFNHENHQFSDTTYYYLRLGGSSGKRIANSNVTAVNPVSVTSFSDYNYHEVDNVNLLKSGAVWLGEVFDIEDVHTFNFAFPNIVPGSEGYVTCSLATASRVESSYTLSGPGKQLTITAASAPGGYGTLYATDNGASMLIKPSGNTIPVTVKYNKPPSYSSARGWLDYIEVNARRRLIMTGTQMHFRDIESAGNAFARFTLSGANASTAIWEITDEINPVRMMTSLNGSDMSFSNTADVIRQYVAVREYDSSFHWSGTVANQDLHASESHDYIIIAHPKFTEAADRLKSIHQARGLKVLLTTPQAIYNEFSSGSQDIVAIRDFIRMVYGRSSSAQDRLKFVAFIGDGSYDNKFRLGGNTNFIPTYESPESYHPAYSFVTDDFYCVLDSGEGLLAQNELMDIGIGRMPVQTADQARKIVDKIERYLSSVSLGDWRNRICFVADDEDHNLHMGDADELTQMVDTLAPEYNIEKIFIDAYQQQSTPGGERYPEAREGIRRQVERGVLILNYTGHGGEVGWAHERILTMDDINSWTNENSLPLFVTATCEFSRWDDPQRSAGGEVVLLNPEGGGIALLTTVRIVFSSGNMALSTAFYQEIFENVNGELPYLGEVYRDVKNKVPGTNTRNFTLLGDPALKLAYPLYNIVTDSVNGKDVAVPDTVRALGLAEIKGHFEDGQGNKLTSFNGTVYPTVFDKEVVVSTLNNDDEGVFNFRLQNKKLFKGKAEVKNGEFKFSFIVPKDISYNYGNGRLSYYGENQVDDANGYGTSIIVGGTDNNAPDDKTGPSIELYMNDETFIYGGITDENPILLARISDEHGINMTGTGIGHDIMAILDGESDDAIVLNDYYSAVINSYQEGEVNYPFRNLSPGPHKLTFKVWDVYNNSSEATLEFVVQDYSDIKIDRVLNYPNPFTTNTSFWFEHNQPGTVLDVRIQIFTISGKIVKTIDQVIESTGYNQNVKNPNSRNGRDENGDKHGRGV